MVLRALPLWRVRASRLTVACDARQWSVASRRGYAESVPFGSQSWQAAAQRAKSGNAEGEGEKVPGLFMGTLVAAAGAVHQTSVAQLLEQIKPQPGQKVRDSPKKPALLALLLTPSYAQHALNGDLPLRLLERLQNGEATSGISKSLDVITAVVDRLPSLSGPDTGREGLSYMFQRNPPPLSVASQTNLSPSAQKPGSLSFELPLIPTRHNRYTIQLPLAQTIFSTGLVSTLVHARYSYSAHAGLVKEHEQHLESQTLRLPFTAEYGVVNSQSPLVPLTPFRTVRNQMGNIVRTISSARTWDEFGKHPSELSAPQPASQELEAAVASYLKAMNLSPEPVKVWALILPDLQQWARTSKMNVVGEHQVAQLTPEIMPQAWAEDYHVNVYRAARLAGGRLHRVLSGGGGWGKKAGLLSLDPDVAYSSRELRADRGWEFDFDDESEGAVQRQQRQALGEIVAEGESIMFLIAPYELSVDAGTEDVSARKRSFNRTMGFVRRADRAAVFGVVPSTVDAVPELVGSTDADDPTRDSPLGVEHHPGLFGALSETGMAVTLVEKDAKRTVTQTKLDVPLNIFKITETEADREYYLAKVERRANAMAAREARIKEHHAKYHTKRPRMGGAVSDTAQTILPEDEHAQPAQRKLDAAPTFVNITRTVAGGVRQAYLKQRHANFRERNRERDRIALDAADTTSAADEYFRAASSQFDAAANFLRMTETVADRERAKAGGVGKASADQDQVVAKLEERAKAGGVMKASPRQFRARIREGSREGALGTSDAADTTLTKEESYVAAFTSTPGEDSKPLPQSSSPKTSAPIVRKVGHQQQKRKYSSSAARRPPATEPITAEVVNASGE